MIRDWKPTVDVLPHIHCTPDGYRCRCGTVCHVDPKRSDDAFEWLRTHRACSRES